MNPFALLSGMIFMMYPIENFKIPHDCYKIESVLEKIAYGQFATLHHDTEAYNKLTALLEETHEILGCNEKILEDHNKRALGKQSIHRIYDQYYMIQLHSQHCPEITTYLEENKSIDLSQLSDHERGTLQIMQEMGKELQCDKESYQFFNMLEVYSHKK